MKCCEGLKMENQKLQQAIENYDVTKTDYELYWELAFSPLVDIEEIVQHIWFLRFEPPNLPVPFLALACRLCLEMSKNPERLREAFTFPTAHRDDGDDPKLTWVLDRLNLTYDSLSPDER